MSTRWTPEVEAVAEHAHVDSNDDLDNLLEQAPSSSRQSTLLLRYNQALWMRTCGYRIEPRGHGEM